MAFKANIEVDTVDEFKKLNETKIIEVPKIVYKDKIKKVEVPVEKIVEKEIVKEVVKEIEVAKCPACGSTELDHDGKQSSWPWAKDDVEYNIQSSRCRFCGYSFNTPFTLKEK